VHVLHAIHDFLPRHQAGSELYALRLARAQLARHHVTMLCADFDPARDHGQVAWRVYDGVPVVELINNWRCASFEETYRSPLIGARIREALLTLRPDVLHVHNLLNLSFDLPAFARDLGIPVVATLHDYTLVCASGGQRVHQRDEHVCVDIDTARCARCFTESPFYENTTLGSLVNGSRSGRLIAMAAVRARRMLPVLTARAAQVARHARRLPVTKSDMDARMAAARQVFSNVDLFVSPSASLARDFVRFGLPAERLRVSDYGMPQWPALDGGTPGGRTAGRPLRIGLIGTLVWHKGAHVLVDALRTLPANSYQATVFGSTDTFPAFAAEVQAKAAGLPIAFAGAFEPEQAATTYRDIDVLVVPSLWPENSPLVIHEAFQAGVAVIGARTGGIPDLIEDNVSGLLFETGSAPDLARRLRALIENPARVSALAAKAPRVKTIEEDVAEWEAAYAEVIGRRVPLPA
jgi:glycosyltransferase involved in cell wall biosynthesis